MNRDELFMRQAHELAVLGNGFVAPNPLVGAVIVQQSRVVSTGYHKGPGLSHAEAMAIYEAKEDLSGATLYCNLEPCCHTNKRTPPCTDLIIKHNISKVVISALDPNPQVSGKGVEQLRQAGIEVVVGALGYEALEINRVFYKVMQEGLPYIHLKWAQTLDGKMVSSFGESKWISDDQAREQVHKLRLTYDGVMIGRATLENDNPDLSIRLVENKGKIPKKIIIGDLEKMNPSSKVFLTNPDQVIIMTTSRGIEKRETLRSKGVQIIETDSTDLQANFKKLLGLGVQSCLVEGGPKLLTSLIESNNFDRITIYVCPVILGNGFSFYENPTRRMSDAIRLSRMKSEKLGEQIVLTLDKKDII